MKSLLFILLFCISGFSVFAQELTLSDTGLLTNEQYNLLLRDAVFSGDKTKPIVIVEFSDFECPFCLRHHKETIPELFSKYHGNDNDGNFVYVIKNNRGVNHHGTEKKAIALLCVKKYGGESAYYNSIGEITEFGGGKKIMPTILLRKYLGQYVLDTKKLNQCISKKETLKEFNQETQDAQSLGLFGTPSFVIFNQKTKKYARIEGAYPYETFRDAIESVR